MTRAPQASTIHVVHLIAGLRQGGAETSLARLIERTTPLGYRHTVISLSDRGQLADRIEAAGGTVIALGRNGGSPRAGALLRLLASVPVIEPDIIQGWMAHGNFAAWLLHTFRFRRARLAWNLRMTLAGATEKRSTMLLTRALARLSRKVDLLIANSETSLGEHLGIGYRPRASIFIPNGFDPALFAPDDDDRGRVRRELGVTDDNLLFGLVGRYHEMKGHRVLIAAAERVAGRFPDARFAFVGAATAGNVELEARIATTGLAPAFILCGPRADVPSVMRALDVLCVPSLGAESFPNVLGEAMAAARPCIASDISDVAAILGDAGLLIPPGDVDALARAMAQLAEAGAAGRAETGARGRQRIVERYTIDHTVASYTDCYSRLARGETDSNR